MTIKETNIEYFILSHRGKHAAYIRKYIGERIRILSNRVVAAKEDGPAEIFVYDWKEVEKPNCIICVNATIFNPEKMSNEDIREVLKVVKSLDYVRILTNRETGVAVIDDNFKLYFKQNGVVRCANTNTGLLLYDLKTAGFVADTEPSDYGFSKIMHMISTVPYGISPAFAGQCEPKAVYTKNGIRVTEFGAFEEKFYNVENISSTYGNGPICISTRSRLTKCNLSKVLADSGYRYEDVMTENNRRILESLLPAVEWVPVSCTPLNKEEVLRTLNPDDDEDRAAYAVIDMEYVKVWCFTVFAETNFESSVYVAGAVAPNDHLEYWTKLSQNEYNSIKAFVDDINAAAKEGLTHAFNTIARALPADAALQRINDAKNTVSANILKYVLDI